MKLTIRGIEFVSGQKIDCIFCCGKVITGTLHISSSDRMFICHDNKTRYHGSTSPVMYGHMFSWTFRYIESDTFTEDVVDIRPIHQSIQIKDVELCGELGNFFQVLNDHNFYYLMRISVKPFEAFNNYKMSDKPGYFVMFGQVETLNGIQEKKVEIKLSRYISKVVSAIKNTELNLHLSDADIEKLHNKFVAFQRGEIFKMETLKGQDILKAYDSSKYTKGHSVLHKSCMSNKFDYLKLYTDNKQVSLAALVSDGEYAARCLVWEIDGKYYFDRIYYSADWIENVLKKKLEEQGFIKLSKYLEENDKKFISIDLDFTNFEKYPFVDSFRHLKGNTLYFMNSNYSVSCLPEGEYKYLNSTNGGFEELRIRYN